MTDQMFKGTSEKGDFQEALSNAVDSALSGGADKLVRWRLYEVTGEKGGLHGINSITVKIVGTTK
jgi:hypothetical protein